MNSTYAHSISKCFDLAYLFVTVFLVITSVLFWCIRLNTPLFAYLPSLCFENSICYELDLSLAWQVLLVKNR